MMASILGTGMKGNYINRIKLNTNNLCLGNPCPTNSMLLPLPFTTTPTPFPNAKPIKKCGDIIP